MRMFSRLSAAALALLLFAASGQGAPVSYGPDSVVDANPSTSYVEPAIAVSPKDSRKLIAGSMLFAAAGVTVAAFRSDDGGYHWRGTQLPTGTGSLDADVQAAFNADGVAYVTSLGNRATTGGKTKNGLYVFRSLDQGETFRQIAFLQTPSGHSYDHEQLAIDRSSGPYRGRIYMTVLYALRLAPQLNGLGLLWSADGGHTFHGPVQVSSGWSFNSRPVVLSSGDIIFPFIHLAKLLDTKEVVEVARSGDGGRTFTAPVAIGTRVVYTIAEMERRLAAGDYAFDADSVPQFAAGRGSARNAQYVYGIWSDVRSRSSRLLFVKSGDQGKHWTTPRVVFATNDPDDAQYQPSIVVNRAGIIGVSWFNGSFARNTVSEMFALSTDDGDTFSAPVAISSVTSPLRTPAAQRYLAAAFPEKPGTFIFFTAPGYRYPSGGDYMDLASDSGGAFHPIWIDARNGFNQVWTATVFPRPPAPVPTGLFQRDVTSELGVSFGVGKWNDTSRELTVPMRLHNLSSEVLYPPFTITVTMTTNPYVDQLGKNRPEVTVLNANNGKPGVGATFTFSAQTLGNLGRLMPGADTSTRTLKVRIANEAARPTLITHIDGYVAH